MVYRDDPDVPTIDSGGGGYSDTPSEGGYNDAPDGGGGDAASATAAPSPATLEVPQYRDNPTPDAGAYDLEDLAPQSVGQVGYTSPKKANRGKLVVGTCLVAALAIAIGVIVRNKNTASDVDNAASKPLFTDPKVGVRGSSNDVKQPSGGCADDPTFIHTNGKTCADFVAHVGRITLLASRCGQDTGRVSDNGEPLLLEHFCRASCGICDDESEEEFVAEINQEMQEVEDVKPVSTSTTAEEQQITESLPPPPPPPPTPPPTTKPPTPRPTRPAHTDYLPGKDFKGDCVDDPNYIHSNGKSCNEFVAHVGRPNLHDARCNQGTGNYDKKGNEILLKHYCKKSCTYCNKEDAAAADEVHAEHMKADEEYLAAQQQAAAEKAEAEKLAAEQAAEQAAAEQAAAEQAAAEQEAAAAAAAAAEEQEGEADIDVTGGDSISEGEVNEPPADEGVPIATEPEEVEVPSTVESPSEIMDYFVPLTSDERDALKTKLRDTLRMTKDALATAPSSTSTQRTLVLDPNTPKQFMNLLNEETGGESVNNLIQCAVGRQNQIASMNGELVVYTTISEDTNLEMCRNDLANRLGATVNDGEFFKTNDQGMMVLFDPSHSTGSDNIPLAQRDACNTASSHVMTYGSSLRAVDQFGWNDVESITMIADPVVRTHEMYQKMAVECYGCKDFKDIMESIYDGTFESDKESCKTQMIGLQAIHLLSSPDLILAANDMTFPREQEIVSEAVRNLREKVTWIGVLDEVDESVRGFKEVFPWLADNLEGAAAALPAELAKAGETVEDDRFALPADYHDAMSCIFQHNDDDHYKCGSKEVDDEALQWINKLNMRDTAVYRAAVERFAIQQEVIEEYHQVAN